MPTPKKLIERHLANAFRKDRSSASPAERLSFGAFWSVAGTLTAQFSAMLTGIIIARLLGKTVYGELGIIASSIDALAVVSGLSLSVTLSKHIAETAATSPGRAGSILRMCGVIAALVSAAAAAAVFIFAGEISSRLLGAPHLAPALRLSSPMVFLGAVYGVQTGALSGFESFRSIAAVNSAKALLQLPLTLAGAYFFSLNGAIVGMTLSSAAACLLAGGRLARETRRRGIAAAGGPLISEPGILLDFSMPAFFSSLLYSPAIWLAGLILATSPGGYAGLGLFNAANQWKTFLLFLPDMISRAVIPVFSSVLAAGDRNEARRLFGKLFLANSAIAIPIALLIASFGDRIMALYGPQFSGGNSVLVLVMGGALLLALESPAGNIIAASGRMWAGMLMNLGWAAVLIISARIFVSKGWGAAGLAAAYATAYAVHGIWTVAFLLKILRQDPGRDGNTSPEETWERFWSGYTPDGGYDATSRAVFEEVRASAGRLKGISALECGSGAGKVSALLAGNGAAVTLLDRSEKALQISREFFSQKGASAVFVRGDIFSLPFKDASFDLVWNSGVLEHFGADRQAAALAEMKRVTKPGGVILVIVPYAFAPLYRLGKYCAELLGTWPFGPEYPVSSLKTAAAAAGLRLEEEHSFDFASQLSFMKFVPGGGQLRRALAAALTENSGRKLFNGYLLIGKLRKPEGI